MTHALPRNPVLLQVLSLYLLLLAFFVVLNSLSATEQDRLRAVTGSLNETFAASGKPARDTRQLTSSMGNIIADAGFLDRIGSLVRTELAFATIREVTPGRLMEVSMPTHELFNGAKVSIDPLYRSTLEDMVAAMLQPSRGVRYEIEILVGTDGGEDLSGTRSAYLATVFTAAGAPGRGIAAGVEHGSPGVVRLRFRVRSGIDAAAGEGVSR